MDKEKLYWYLQVLLPTFIWSFVVFLIIVLARSEIFTEWDGIVYFLPTFHHSVRAFEGIASLAFSDEWFSGNPFLADYQTFSLSVYTLLGVLLSKFFSIEVSFSLMTLVSVLFLSAGQAFLLRLIDLNVKRVSYIIACSVFLGHFYFGWGHTVTYSALIFCPWILGFVLRLSFFNVFRPIYLPVISLFFCL